MASLNVTIFILYAKNGGVDFWQIFESRLLKKACKCSFYEDKFPVKLILPFTKGLNLFMEERTPYIKIINN